MSFFRDWIDLDNLRDLFRAGLSATDVDAVDVVSLDLDGNDWHLVKCLLEEFAHPALFIVEYNAKFPPPVEFVIPYDKEFRWDGNDYFGASLVSYAKLFEKHGYSLICCNAATGSNAFFVQTKYLDRFPEVPSDIREIFSQPHYDMPASYGHHPCAKTVQHLIR